MRNAGLEETQAGTPVLWPPHVKSWLIGEDSDAGRDWGREEKGTTEDEMAGWHHWSMDMSLSELREVVMDREAWHAAIHRVAKSRTRLSDWSDLIQSDLIFIEILNVPFHLQLLQNIGYIPCVVQYITEPVLHTLLCTSHLPYPYIGYAPLHPYRQPLVSSLFRWACFFSLIFTSLLYLLDSLYKWFYLVFVSNSFHKARYPPSPSMFLQMAKFYYFLWLNSISLCMYILYIYT